MHGSLVDYCVEFLLLLSGVGIRMLGEDEQDGLDDCDPTPRFTVCALMTLSQT